jgi:FkbM family methyltransferase
MSEIQVAKCLGAEGELSYRNAVIRLLDRPGGRFLLGKLATGYLKRIGGDGIELLYADRMWARRVGRNFFPDGRRFEYTFADFDIWRRQAEVYESDTREYWLRYYKPKEGDVVVDVGAGRGEDTLTLSKGVGKTGRVIAIEAHPGTYAILKSFCRLNGLSNVTVLQVAVMDKPGTVRIMESESSWTENAIDRSGKASDIEVGAATLEEVWREQGLREVAFLKMNIEGAERYALVGMGSLMQHTQQICVACHDFRSELGHGEEFRTRAFVEQFLKGHGFTIMSRSDDPRAYVRDHIFGVRA